MVKLVNDLWVLGRNAVTCFRHRIAIKSFIRSLYMKFAYEWSICHMGYGICWYFGESYDEVFMSIVIMLLCPYLQQCFLSYPEIIVITCKIWKRSDYCKAYQILKWKNNIHHQSIQTIRKTVPRFFLEHWANVWSSETFVGFYIPVDPKYSHFHFTFA